MTLARWLLPPLFACLFMPTLALADARSGPYIVGGLMLDAGTATDIGGKAEDSASLQSQVTLGKAKTGGTLAAGYQFALGSRFVLMVEAGKDFGADLSLSTSLLESEPDFTTSALARRWHVQRDWHVALKPGWQVSPSTTVYLSLAQHRGSARLDNQADVGCLTGVCQFSSAESFNGRLRGTGIGLGLMSMLSGQWFVRAEVERIDFDTLRFNRGELGNINTFFTRNELDASNTVGRVMIGWRF